MISKKCRKCGKIIEGYSKKHVKFLLSQHAMGKQHKKGKGRHKSSSKREEKKDSKN